MNGQLRRPLPTHTSFLHTCRAQCHYSEFSLLFPIFKNTHISKAGNVFRCPPLSPALMVHYHQYLTITEPHLIRTAEGMTSPALLPSPRGQWGFYLTLTSPVSKSLIPGWGAGKNCHPLALVLEPERVSVWVHFPSWRILAIVNLWGSLSLPVNHTYRIVGITQCTKRVWLVSKDNCSH